MKSPNRSVIYASGAEAQFLLRLNVVAEEVAEKIICYVIPSEARNLSSI
jgi:hypothetical protein